MSCDLGGKVVVITGGCTDVVKKIAQVLLTKNARVYIGGLEDPDSRRVINELSNVTGWEVRLLAVDFADLKSVRAAAAILQTQETQLHVL